MKRPISPFIALRFRDFRLLWTGLFISAIGSQMQVVGVTWHIYEITHSPFSLGFIGLARFVPLLVVSPFGGLIADTFDRKKIIIVNQLVFSLTAFLLFIATFFSSATTLLPIFAKDILNVGPQGLGLLYAASSVGAIFAGLLFSSFPYIRHQGKILIVSVLLYGITTIFFGLSKLFIFSFVFLALSGAADMISTVIRNTLRQLNTPDHLRGRMTSINSIFYNGGPELGEVEAGILAGFLGAPASVVIGGIGTIIITFLITFFVPKLRKYQGNDIVI